MHSTLLYLAFFIIIIPTTTQARENNLRHRRDGIVSCPCIDYDIDDKLINSHNLEIDLHRQLSCASNEPDTIQRIYWTPIDPNARPAGNLIQPIDGVDYNYLKVIYDPHNSYYSCTRNDERMDKITHEQAQVCMTTLQDTCSNVMPRLCSFDVTFMEALKKSFADEQNLVLDQERSCKDPSNREEENFGIYTKAPSASTKVALSYDKDTYIVNSVSKKITDEVQGTHCTNLIDSICSGWKLTRREDSQCRDDPDFRLHVNIVEEEFESVKDFFTRAKNSSHTLKNCDWVTEDLSRCSARTRNGHRAFESCRKTCGTCACSDNDNYRFNGQDDKGCEWIKDGASTRCSLEGASEHCKVSCDTKCCQDTPNFRFENDDQKTCGWAAMEKEKRCAKREVALNCPQTCGLCSFTQ